MESSCRAWIDELRQPASLVRYLLEKLSDRADTCRAQWCDREQSAEAWRIVSALPENGPEAAIQNGRHRRQGTRQQADATARAHT